MWTFDIFYPINPNTIVNNALGDVGELILGIFVLIIAVLMMTNKIKLPGMTFKWLIIAITLTIGGLMVTLRI